MKAMNGKHLGMIIRDHRKRLKLTQDQVAKTAGVKQDTISKMEMDASRSKVDTLFKVFNDLGLELQVNKQSDVSGDLQW